jgi:uncharacterized membrane protein YraQ (UPF0718 family)
MARIAVSIVLEASPFLLLGSLLSVVIDRYLNQDRIARCVPVHPIARIAVGLVGGLLLPICECGSVPVARRLLAKGVPSQTAIVYMLCAPVINPVVLLSTYVAFGGNMQMVLARILLVAFSASILGWMLGDRTSLKKSADLHDEGTSAHPFIVAMVRPGSAVTRISDWIGVRTALPPECFSKLVAL